MQLQKDYVNVFLMEHFERIQEERKLNGFSWKSIIEQLLTQYPEMRKDPKLVLDPDNEAHRDRIRGNFLSIRKRSRAGLPLVPKNILKQIIQAPLPTPTVEPVKTTRRLIFDIETSPNIVFSWNIGYKINLGMDNIIQERAIICICYKWEGEKEVYAVFWNKGDDKELLEKFAEVINTADEVVTHNGDNYDIKWVRARCMFHNIPLSPKLNSIDTLKMARAQFRLNSNKLNYIAQFLGLGEKIHTEFNLWKEICLNNDQAALDKMIAYCVQDVLLLEKVFHKLRDYSPPKKFRPRTWQVVNYSGNGA